MRFSSPAHGIELGSMWSQFTWRQRLAYWTRRTFLELVYTLPPVRWVLNRVLMWRVEAFFAKYRGKNSSSSSNGEKEGNPVAMLAST